MVCGLDQQAKERSVLTDAEFAVKTVGDVVGGVDDVDVSVFRLSVQAYISLCLVISYCSCTRSLTERDFVQEHTSNIFRLHSLVFFF